MLVGDCIMRDLAAELNPIVRVDAIACLATDVREYVLTDGLAREFARVLEPIIDSAKPQGATTDKIGVWVSGFFGSGKSDFAKIAGHLLANTSTTGDAPRFLHLNWECGNSRTWRPASKGDGYCKWFGLQMWSLDWTNSGESIKKHPGSYIRNEALVFREGVTYTEAAQGHLGTRVLESGETFAKSGPGLIADPTLIPVVLSTLNARISSYLARIVARSFLVSLGAVRELPVVSPGLAKGQTLWSVGVCCVALKRVLVSRVQLERSFTALIAERSD